MNRLVWFSALLSSVCLLLPLLYLLYFIARKAIGEREWSKAQVYVLAACAVMLGSLYLRPHQYVYQGLDTAAYRNMARAFVAGRSFHDVDQAFLEVPKEVRPWILLYPGHYFAGNRFTRDSSFQITSFDDGETMPFFYPLLPLNMAASEILMPFGSLDYPAPFAFLCLSLALVLYAGAKAGIWGMLLGVAVMIASPIPLWIGRGSYPEAVAAALIGLALVSWLLIKKERLPLIACCFSLGLAVSYHPLMLLPVFPLCVILLLSSGNIRNFVFGAVAALAGLAPIVLLTEWVCAPYGVLRPDAVRGAIIGNASVRPAFILSVVFLCVILLSVPVYRLLKSITVPFWCKVAAKAVMLLLWTFPTLLAMRYWGGGQQYTIRAGLSAFYDSMQWYLAALIILLVLLAAIMRGMWRQRLIITVAMLSLPMFLYLKGVEIMGLWSLRRLVAPWILVLIPCFTAAIVAMQRIVAFSRKEMSLLPVFSIPVLIICLINPLRWPAPYLVRYEHGADKFVDELVDEFSGATVCFDYIPHSLPLAVLPGEKFYGLAQGGGKGLPGLSRWMREEALQGPTYWITAYKNPGIEKGVRLESQGRRSIVLQRARARTALPAVRDETVKDFEALKVVPLRDGETAALDKVFELGRRPGNNRPQLAVRGKWGRSDIAITLDDGTRLPAQWSRTGSAVIGPVPAPGETVDITIEAAASRIDGHNKQVIMVVPPWGGKSLELTVDNEYCIVGGTLQRPADDDGYDEPTGRYLLQPRWPYDPASVGIRGFEKDLGILLHRIRIE